jgi:hypothetical protein
VVIVGIAAFTVGRHMADNGGARRKRIEARQQNARVARFVVGDIVRIQGEAHEWVVVQKLEDSKVVLDYNEEGLDYNPWLVMSEKDLELA